MILECPSCGTRYLVQIGLFAQGGRRVRCARCKHVWPVTLSNAIDVVEVPPDFSLRRPEMERDVSGLSSMPPPPPFLRKKTDSADSKTDSSSDSPSESKDRSPLPSPASPPGAVALPAVVAQKSFVGNAVVLLCGVLVGIVLVLILMLGLHALSEASFGSGAFSSVVDLPDKPSRGGLVFGDVKSELRYDSGTMKLFVDGVIKNTGRFSKDIPAVRAQALSVDGAVIKTWWINIKAQKVRAGETVRFHTEIPAPMERTIEDVFLEFISGGKDSYDP
ncbi:MAG: zinc-ribbon domain-containing protein [Alphaproteobacteria bacterium]|nr:zinc-ribbon domain-containing protein [Alphaproteobacteria bacterium]